MELYADFMKGKSFPRGCTNQTQRIILSLRTFHILIQVTFITRFLEL